MKNSYDVQMIEALTVFIIVQIAQVIWGIL